MSLALYVVALVFVVAAAFLVALPLGLVAAGLACGAVGWLVDEPKADR